MSLVETRNEREALLTAENRAAATVRSLYASLDRALPDWRRRFEAVREAEAELVQARANLNRYVRLRYAGAEDSFQPHQ